MNYFGSKFIRHRADQELDDASVWAPSMSNNPTSDHNESVNVCQRMLGCIFGCGDLFVGVHAPPCISRRVELHKNF